MEFRLLLFLLLFYLSQTFAAQFTSTNPLLHRTLTLLVTTTIKDLTANDETSFKTEALSWTLTKFLNPAQRVYNCNNIYYLGGYGLNSIAPTHTKIYSNLSSHDIIHYSITLTLIDSWNPDDAVLIRFDSISIKPFYDIDYPNFPAFTCGGTFKDLVHFQVQGKMPHNSSSLNLTIISASDQDSTNEALGIRDVVVVFLTNTSSQPQQMFAQAPNFNLLSQFKHTCGGTGTYNFTTNSCATCHANCSLCFGVASSQCLECTTGYAFYGDQCLLCFYQSNDKITCFTECQGTRVLHSTLFHTCVCPSGKMLNYDDTCIPDDCKFPYYIKSGVVEDICTPICEGNISAYASAWETGVCYPSCDPPLRSFSLQDGVNYCYPPQCGLKNCSRCETTSDCKESYVCKDTVGGGFCVLNTEYKLSATLAKAITNGYIILLQVTPPLDLIEGTDNIVKVTVKDMTLNTDYQLAIKTIAVQTIQVKILTLKSMDVDQQMQTSFLYSPSRLKLTAQLTLPNPSYISEALESASEGVGSATNIGSYIFIICIVLFAVLGNMNKIWSLLIINQYMHYLLYLSVAYLTPTATYLRGLGNYSLVFFSSNTNADTDPELLKELKLAWPQRFIDEEYPINLVKCTAQIFAILGAMIFTVSLMRLILGMKNFLVRFILKMAKKLRWNGLLQQVLTYSLPLILAAFMQINLAIFCQQSNLPSLVLSLIILLFLIRIFFKSFTLIQAVPHGLYSRVLFSDKYGALWRGLNLHTKRSRYYYWAIGMRSVLLAYIVAFFGIYPNIQLTAIITYQFFILSFYFQGFKRLKPCQVFVDKLVNRISLLAESLLLIMKFAILIFKIINEKTKNENILIYSALLIVCIGVLIQLSLLGFAIYMQIKNRKQLIDKIRGVWRNLTGKAKKPKIKRLRRKNREQTTSSTFQTN